MRFSTALVCGSLPALFLALVLLSASSASAYPERTSHDRTFPANGGGDFVLADLTGDGRVDLAAEDDRNGLVWIYPATDLGIPGQTPSFVQLGGVENLKVTDLDGDGGKEVVALGSNETWWIYWSPGDGELYADGLGIGGGDRVAAGDMNGDGRADLAVVDKTEVRVFFQRIPDDPQRVRFLPNHDRAVVDISEPHSLLVGDMDGDGWEDLVYATAQDIVFYPQREKNLALEPVRMASSCAAGSVALGLLAGAAEGPGLVTVCDGGSTEGIAALWQWNGTALRSLQTWTGPYTARIDVGDVDDDGRSDLAVVQDDGDIALIRMPTTSYSSARAFASRLDGPNGTDGVVRAGDANGDGIEDIMLRMRDPDAFYVYLQEDTSPTMIAAIPSTYAVNRKTTAENAIDLHEYYVDDHHRLTFAVVHESDPDHLHATVDGHFLDFLAADWLGRAEFRVSAWDGNPDHLPIESNTFSVLVNDPPTVTSQPPSRAVVGQLYEYLTVVQDTYPTDDQHSFTLLKGPEGMTVDAATGLVAWMPREGQVGVHHVAVEARDAHGGVAVQPYTIIVSTASAGPSVPLLFASAIAISSSVLAAAALLNENAKYALFLIFVPLYSKIRRERVLDHFVRGQIYGYVQANPGEHYNAIKDALGLTNGSLAHHLRTLEREQFVKSRRYGLYRRFYPMHMRLPEDGAFEPNEIQRTILSVIRQQPGITQKEVAVRLGLTPPTVNYHVSVLSEHHLIDVGREGRSTHLTIAKEQRA